MKKRCLIVFAAVVAIIIGLGNLTSVRGSDTLLEFPGVTILGDSRGDLLLRNCDPSHPGIPCSLPPGASLDLPGYFDIRSAMILQIGRGLVDLVILVDKPIPSDTPYGFVSYIWQFAGGCVNQEPGSKDSISLVWQDWEGNGTPEWRAYWYEITSCVPRTIVRGDPVPFKFIWKGARVRVALDDLLTAINPDPGYLEWHAAVRRIPFIYHPQGLPNFPNTAAVDYAPDVFEFVECGIPPVPPCYSEPEDFAHWEPFSFHR
jgi:hypothetical protein